MSLNYTELARCTPFKGVLGEGSVNSNELTELMFKNTTHLVISVIMCFEKVRRGLIHVNYPVLEASL